MNLNKVTLFISIGILLIAGNLIAGNEDGLQLHYTFEETSECGTIVTDATGNGYPAQLYFGAKTEPLGDLHILNLGTNQGYLDLGSEVGELIGRLEDFTIATYLLVDCETDLSRNGQTVWNFGNSDRMGSEVQTGLMFFSAHSTRYGISLTSWNGMQTVDRNSPYSKGVWQHVVYRQSENRGTIYIDGEPVVGSNVSLRPSHLGNTTHNYIGRSAYPFHTYLKNALLTDFRIYDIALDESAISDLAVHRSQLQEATVRLQLEGAAEDLLNEGYETLFADIHLPAEWDKGISVAWHSSAPDVISNEGNVTRPDVDKDPVDVVLTAVLSKEGETHSHDFHVTVFPWLDDLASVQRDAENLFLTGNIHNLRVDMELPESGTELTTITWESDQPDILSDYGELISLSSTGNGKQLVNLTATISKGAESMVRNFEVFVAEDEGYVAYLFTYFVNMGEAVYYAISHDGFNFTALNENQPVISPDTISSRGGVRDPHILRGPDGMFYMVVTDLRTLHGWSNDAMVFLKSADLIDWSHSVVNIAHAFPEFQDVNRVWAPQSIYDEEQEKIMVYFSMRQPGGYDIIYYAYANEDFTGLEAAPQQLLYHPREVACIDGDIFYKDGLYHLFFKNEGTGNGVKKAVSDRLTEGYVVQEPYFQQTTSDVEGSFVYRLTNTDTYIMMYDVYQRWRYQFTKSYDLEKFEVIDHLVSLDFHPRHGSVIAITQEELNALNARYGDPTTAMAKVIDEPSRMVVYPNPAKNLAEVLVPNEHGCIGSIAIYGLSGIKLSEQPVNHERMVIDVSHLSPGNYLVVYKQGDFVRDVQKMVISDF